MTVWNWFLHGRLDTHTHNKPHPHSQVMGTILRALGVHILVIGAHLHCSHPMALQVYAPYPPIYDEIFQRTS